MANKHPNSRIVTILRKSSFIGEAQVQSAPEFVSQSKKSIGSFWSNSFSKVVGSGLSFEEQRILMPSLVDCEPNDRNFRAKVAEYFATIRTVVPYEKGRELEIGLLKSNNEDISEDNMPIELNDYITYRHAIAHPLVAKSKDEADGNLLKEYYIFDPQANEDKQVRIAKERDRALGIYLNIKENPAKVVKFLTLLGVDASDPKKFNGKNADALRAEKLKEVVNKTPDKFLEVYESKFFEELYLITVLKDRKLLSVIGERVVDAERGETLGHTLKEAAAWFRDDRNSEHILMLKTKLQEAVKYDSALLKAAGGDQEEEQLTAPDTEDNALK